MAGFDEASLQTRVGGAVGPLNRPPRQVYDKRFARVCWCAMLQRVEHENGVVFYQSPLLREVGVRHGFSTRIGGVSAGAYATLNLGSLAKGPGTDDNTLVAENFRRFRRAVGLERVMRVTVRQVHGCDIWRPPPEVASAKHSSAPEADAMVSDDPAQMLTIRTADCVPVLIASADGAQVAAVHAGWRGIIAGVIEAAVGAMAKFPGPGAGRLVAAIGPCISQAHFEVDADVADQFEGAGLAGAIAAGPGSKSRIDLAGAVRAQLERCGLPPEKVEGTDRCTYRDEAEFFSHRRDVTHGGQRVTGRMAAVIAAGNIREL